MMIRLSGITPALGADELEELRWYYDDFTRWPADVERARGIAAALAGWGRRLHSSLPADPDELATTLVDPPAQPWELLHDDAGFLALRQPLRRQLTGLERAASLRASGPLRLLMIVPRPAQAGLIDPTGSVNAALDAVRALGDSVELHVLRPATLSALRDALATPWDVVHFDGHGHRRRGVPRLCFAHTDPVQRARGAATNIPLTAFAEALSERPPRLVILEACHSAGEVPGLPGGAAAPLLSIGIASVIGMAHAVSVGATRVLFEQFYQSIASGAPIAEAMWRARVAMAQDEDEAIRRAWPVAVLTQAGDDHALVDGPGIDAAAVPRLFPMLPASAHPFVGRWRARLHLDHTLDRRAPCLLIGPGGQGKTALAAEVARWRVRIGSVQRVAFVSLEQVYEATGLLARLGRQLVSEVFTVREIEEALTAIEAAIGEEPTLVLLDNCESAITPDAGSPALASWQRGADLEATLRDLIDRLCGHAEVVLTSRIALPDAPLEVIELAGLSAEEGAALIAAACSAVGVVPGPADRAELRALVDAVHGHPRSLVQMPTLFDEAPIAQLTEHISALLMALEARARGHRERSLLASARLSLERLPARMWPWLGPLATLSQGVVIWVAHVLLGRSETEFEALIAELEAVGLLTREIEGAWLRFHPAFTTLLGLEPLCGGASIDSARRDEVYLATVEHLYANLNGPRRGFTSRVARAELPNLLAALRSLATSAGVEVGPLEVALGYATELEGVLEHTGLHTAQGWVGEVREALLERLEATGTWSRALVNARYMRINAGLGQGRMLQAWQASRALVERCEAVGARDEIATYDFALVLWQHARAAREVGRAEEALPIVERAWRMFATVREAPGAVRMSGLCIAERAQIYSALGRYDAAIEAFTRAAAHARGMDDHRAQAVAIFNRAEARRLARQFDRALRDYALSRSIYAELDEPAAARSVLAGIGLVHQHRGDLDAAERAFAEALAEEQAAADRSSAAETMRQLGVLAAKRGRIDDAVAWDRRALAEHQAMGDRRAEGMSWHNLGRHLVDAGRVDEARRALREAADILGELGLSAHPWRPWNALAELALSQGAVDAVAEQSAYESYEAWREQGGASVIEPEASRLLQAATRAQSVVAREGRFEPFAEALNAAGAGRVRRDLLASLAPTLRYEIERFAGSR